MKGGLLVKERVHIHSYESALRLQRRADCHLWKHKMVTFVCQEDVHFSAQFAMCMLELMYAVRAQTHKGAYRLLLLSHRQTPDQSLQEALRLVCPGEVPPGHSGFTEVTFGIPPRGTPVSTELSMESFFEFAESECLNMVRGNTIVLFCAEVTAERLRARLPEDYIIMFNNMAYLEQIRDELITNKSPDRKKILFITGPDHVPVTFHSASHLIMESIVDVEVWERSRIIGQLQQVSMHHIGMTYVYRLQCPNDREVGLFLPPGEENRGNQLPHRQLDNAQAWGFIADLALHFRDLKLAKLAACFMQNVHALDTVLCHFAGLGFMRPTLTQGVRNFSIPESARDMPVLLTNLGHDFHLSWLLSVGMKQSNITTAAKRALVRIVALARVKFRVIDKTRLMANRQSMTSAQELALLLEDRVKPHFTMPGHLYLHGSIWSILAVWHAVQCSTSSRPTSDQDWLEVPDLRINPQYSECALRTLTWLNQKFRLETSSTSVAVTPLHLVAGDCRLIQQALVNTCLHKALILEALPLDPSQQPAGFTGLCKYNVADAVSATTGDIMPNRTEIFRPWAALGTPGTEKHWAVLAAFDFQISVSYIRFYADSIVLPLELVDSWKSADDEDFIDATMYRDSCPRAMDGMRYSRRF